MKLPTYDNDLWYAPIGASDLDVRQVRFPDGSFPMGKHANGYEIASVGNSIRDKLGRTYTHGAPDGIPTNPCDPRRLGYAVGDVIQTAHHWRDSDHNGGDWYVIWHYKVLVNPAGQAFRDVTSEYAGYMADLWNSGNNPSLYRIMSTQLLYAEIVSTNLSNLSEQVTNGINQTGRNAHDVVSSRMAIVVQKVTGVRGRSNFGRTYLPRPSEVAVTDGNINTSVLPNVNAFAAGMVEWKEGNLTPWQGVVFSEKLSTPTSFHTTNIKAFSTHSTLGSRRDRLKRLR